ncbi:putative transcriptional regulator, TetR family protein [Streptomyces bingchenggensis BCW-1]|uniref:Putative transcriptional regulator, TetR family protein n=1 Tax=Streptomyces bingchenggensis (strain BCW-1) TaxID=749414 RepID=D7C0L2_STRBB|nr:MULTISPECIES: TetR/AcrR family transcriptional regulator [Streptomyces]ADI03703.1 putative transcriptional regulator, TetR family protein [Streptomyces bingchenggensis BCW-1]
MSAMATEKRPAGGMSERRRTRLRLEISREAARLFWKQGVAATSGDQIADAVGLSTRTIWRHFRSKEACAEPIVMQGVVTLMSVLHSWPKDSSLEDHLAGELVRLQYETRPVDLTDEMLAMKMIRLADTEPALRTAWLMACDQTEQQLRVIIGDRLGRPAGDLEVRLHAAATAAVVRVLDEQIGVAFLADAGAGATELTEVKAAAGRFAHAIRAATGGAVGDPIA